MGSSTSLGEALALHARGTGIDGRVRYIPILGKLRIQFQSFDQNDESHRQFKFPVYFMQRLSTLLQCFIHLLSFYKNAVYRFKFEPAT